LRYACPLRQAASVISIDIGVRAKFASPIAFCNGLTTADWQSFGAAQGAI
jgi:hypothetical protein